ncbi:pyridoxamine 5'-phosphate oxidase [Aequorivita echinoideorum]|uniref:Pyridoxine/pyridoxamine 5'-phosphate oxidase n=1 Tax=Aequorivita echinoideorum TaxID=1549647 RepID=A0ABS5S5U9_9FLAO|nr:pyridoxamine 5'-phosphate oxidase [Aequorivita echinoideorum]MBT0608559.1 pyridoxamine 5'-phosphate oxidase [Aequorivita echinoideorum]
MAENLHSVRKSYEKDELSKKSIAEKPMDQFSHWFSELKKTNELDEIHELNAMTLTTMGIDGFPKGRVVLLKKFDAEGFYFYTNYGSEKGKAIAENPKVSLSFFWPNLERQVIVKGIAEKTSEEDSSEYFHSRPKGSQLGAAVSQQSSVVESRDILEEKLKELEKKYENVEVPKPLEWGGYKITPLFMEFWQGRRNRLHDRILYTLEKGGTWKIERLAP